jgi:signal transduction histidine kinase
MLLGFGVAAWAFVNQAGRKTLDSEIQAVAQHFIQVGPRNADGDPVEFYGEELNDVAFLVEHAGRDPVYRSPNWPSAVDNDHLPYVPAEGRHQCMRRHAAWAWDQTGPTPSDTHGGRHMGMGTGDGKPNAPEMHVGARSCPCSKSLFSTVKVSGKGWRIGTFPDGPMTLFVAVDLERSNARAASLAGGFLIALPFALLAAGFGGWWLANRALRPVAALTVAAEEITAARLDRRIPEANADHEFARLTQVFNGMLERLEGSYRQAVRFSADVSHELKTPLAIMQGEVETALQDTATGSPAQVALASQLEEIQRLTGLVKKLLLLSRADAKTLEPQLERFDLSELVTGCSEDFEALSPGLRFEVDVAPGVFVQADPGLLPVIPRNLIANATHYNKADGVVAITLKRTGGNAVLTVSNSGPPIDAEQALRVFDRFYRGDPARGRQAGAGLGLSLALEFARAHNGTLELEERTGDLNRFTFRLPLDTTPKPVPQPV